MNFFSLFVKLKSERQVKRMQIGEIIKKYGEENSMTQFINDSGLSRTYVYNLIKNENRLGTQISPSITTIERVAKGMHCDFADVFNALDFGYVVKESNVGRPKKEKEKERPELRKLLSVAKHSSPEHIVIATKLLKSLNALSAK